MHSWQKQTLTDSVSRRSGVKEITYIYKKIYAARQRQADLKHSTQFASRQVHQKVSEVGEDVWSGTHFTLKNKHSRWSQFTTACLSNGKQTGHIVPHYTCIMRYKSNGTQVQQVNMHVILHKFNIHGKESAEILQLHFRFYYNNSYTVPLGHRWLSQSLHTPTPSPGRTVRNNHMLRWIKSYTSDRLLTKCEFPVSPRMRPAKGDDRRLKDSRCSAFPPENITMESLQ